MKIAELFAEIGFKFDTLKLKELGTMLSNVNVSSILGAASVAKLGEVVKDLLVSSTQTSIALANLSKSTGLPTDYIQRFEDLAYVMGATKEEADGVIESISKLQTEISQGNGNAATPFIKMGINPIGKGKEELIALVDAKLSDPTFLKNWGARFAKDAKTGEEITASFVSSVGAQLGITGSMLRVMSTKPGEFNKRLNPATSDFVVKSDAEIKHALETLGEFRLATNNANLALQKLADALLPIATALINIINKNHVITDIASWIETPINKNTLKPHLPSMQDIVRSILPKSNNWDTSVGHTTGNKSLTNNVYVQVHANDPQAFTKAFKPHLDKLLSNADIQFMQTT